MALNPSQRITLIREITSRLENEGWPLIDLTLKQFSLPTSNDWGGGPDGYIVRMVEDAPDQALIDLAQHVGFNFEETRKSGIDPSFWRKGMLRVFLTHLATKRASAAAIQEACLPFGISCFVAHNDIEPTAEWQTQIETALATCESLVALLHPEFHASNWTDQEIGFAMGRGVPVFGVQFGQTLYGFIGRFQAFAGNEKSAPVLAKELFDAYRKHKQTQRRMSEVLIGLFEQSESFAQAKSRIGYLEDLAVWEPSFSARLKSAVEANSQISGAWDVPERVKALIKKWRNSDF
jgi:TIR domain